MFLRPKKQAVYRTLKIVNQPEDKISTNHDVFSIIFLSGKASLYYSSYSYYAEINCHGGCYLVPPVVTYFVEEDISWVVIS